MKTMKKLVLLILALMLAVFATSCGENPNASPVDKKGGYHTSSVYVK